MWSSFDLSQNVPQASRVSKMVDYKRDGRQYHSYHSWWGPLYLSAKGRLSAHVLTTLKTMCPEIPILLTSATLPPATLKDCCSCMNVDLNDSYFLNLGNHCPNITTQVLHMDGSTDYKVIYNVLVMSAKDLLKTIILWMQHRPCVMTCAGTMVPTFVSILIFFMPIKQLKPNNVSWDCLKKLSSSFW